MRRSDLSGLVPMRVALHGQDEDEAHSDLEDLLLPGSRGAIGTSIVFVAERSGVPVGFAEVMLRSHAEGCWDYTVGGRMGIAHLEAWWVEPHARRSGVGQALVAAVESWAREQGSPVLASDAELDNVRSHRAHRALGFAEVERTVHFVKELVSGQSE